MKVVLATAPDEWATKDHLPPLSLCYLAAVLENDGHNVEIVDSPTYSGYGPGNISWDITTKRPDLIGITATSHNRFQAIELCRRLRRDTSAPIIVGGPHFSMTDIDALQNSEDIDIVVRGEGETTIREILSGKPLSEIAGTTYRDGSGAIKRNPDRHFITDLDSLPMPARHLLDFGAYTATLEGEYKTKATGIISSRGCPNECVFCVNRAYWRRTLRFRSPRKLVDEIEHVRRQYSFDGFDFWDDTFTIAREHAVAICHEIIRRKLDIAWYARARVDTVNRNLLELMKRAGCCSISYGIETGSPKVMETIKKNISLFQAEEAVKASARLGFHIKLFFMFGHPGETMDDVKATLGFMDRLANYSPKISCMRGYTVIYPGTELESMARQWGILPTDFRWNSSYSFERNKPVKANPAVPLFENPGLPLGEIEETIRRWQRSPVRLASRGLRMLVPNI